MPARLNPNVFVIFGANFTQLERRTHFTVEFILLLSNTYVVLRCVMNQEAQVGVESTFTIRIQVTVDQSLLSCLI